MVPSKGEPVHASSANLPSGEIGDCHVTAAARVVPHPFLGISVSDFRKFKCTTHKKFRECVVSHILKVPHTP